MESIPYIKVIIRPERVILGEIRPRMQGSIELDEAIRHIRERGEMIIHQTTWMHIGSLNEMYTSLADLRRELVELGEKALELISETDHDIVDSMRRYLPSTFVVSDYMNLCLSNSRVNIIGRRASSNEQMSDEDEAYPIVQPTVREIPPINTRISDNPGGLVSMSLI